MTVALEQVQLEQGRRARGGSGVAAGQLARHPGPDAMRLVVDDEHGEETLTVLRSAVELLARILAHMAAGQGVSVEQLRPAGLGAATKKNPALEGAGW